MAKKTTKKSVPRSRKTDGAKSKAKPAASGRRQAGKTSAGRSKSSSGRAKPNTASRSARKSKPAKTHKKATKTSRRAATKSPKRKATASGAKRKSAAKKAPPRAGGQKKVAKSSIAAKHKPRKLVAPKKTNKTARLKEAARKVAARKTAARKAATAKTSARSKRSAKAPDRPARVEKPQPLTLQPTGTYNDVIVCEPNEITTFPKKSPYTRKELKTLRDALTNERDRLQKELALLDSTNREALDLSRDHPGYSLHLAEHATDLQTAEASLGVRAIVQRRLNQVTDALRRMNESRATFGLCMASGAKIGIQRLIAQPHARLSVDCQRRYEKNRNRRGH